VALPPPVAPPPPVAVPPPVALPPPVAEPPAVPPPVPPLPLLLGVTHGTNRDNLMDLYTTLPWACGCAEVAKLNVALKRRSAPYAARRHMDALHRGFTRRVRELMKRRELSANRLADFSGLGRGRVSEILAGKTSPTLRTMGKLADALEVPVRDLMPE
jgi:hypothetical protein